MGKFASVLTCYTPSIAYILSPLEVLRPSQEMGGAWVIAQHWKYVPPLVISSNLATNITVFYKECINLCTHDYTYSYS